MLYIPLPDKPIRMIVDWFQKVLRTVLLPVFCVILTEVLMFFPHSRLQKKVWNCWMICGLPWRKLKLKNPKRRKRVSWSGSMQLMDLTKYGHCFGFCYWCVIHNSCCVCLLHLLLNRTICCLCTNGVCVLQLARAQKRSHTGWRWLLRSCYRSCLSPVDSLVVCVTLCLAGSALTSLKQLLAPSWT